jgi:hypothetical protein
LPFRRKVDIAFCNPPDHLTSYVVRPVESGDLHLISLAEIDRLAKVINEFGVTVPPKQN